MAQITPWDIAESFNNDLARRRLMEQEYGYRGDINTQNVAARQAAATTLFGRQLVRDEINHKNLLARGDLTYERQLARDEAARKFRHNENYLTHVTYWHDPMAAFGGMPGMTADPTAAQPPPVDTMPTGAVEAPGGGATDASGRVTPQSAYSYLTSRGMPAMVAAGIVGNIDVETGWDQDVFSGARMGDNNTAGFSGQWRGPRLEHLFEFARSRGHSQPTAEDQLDFYYEEAMSGRDAGARQAFELAAQASSPEEAAHAIMQHYERPNPQYANAGRRASAARAIYGAGGAGAEPMPTTQRRYGMTNPEAAYTPTADMPMYGEQTPEEDYAAEAAAAEDEAAFVQPAQAWTPDDYAANGVDPYLAGVPEDMDVVGTGTYSDTGVQLMPDDMRNRLLPSGVAPNQYLITQPKMGSQGTQAPTPQLQQIPSGKKTRRNPDTGELEINVDGQWQSTGG